MSFTKYELVNQLTRTAIVLLSSQYVLSSALADQHENGRETDEIPVIVQEEVGEEEPFFNEELDQDFDSQSTLLEEVIVTSTKRETDLLQTPVAVSTFSQDDLDREKVLDITNITDLVPNLQIGESPSDSGVSIAVRGLSSNNYTEIGDPTVGIHVDGIYTPRPQAALALLHDVERIEINRGPQGTLFGRNSTAGSINVISKRPDFSEYAYNVELDVGSWERTTFRGWANLALSDSFALRYSVLFEQAGSYLNQSNDTFDFRWDDNNDGDFNDHPADPRFPAAVNEAANPDCQLAASARPTGLTCYDVPADGIPNTDQREARNVSGKDVYGATDRYGMRLSAMLATNDSYRWLLSLDYFKDNSPGGFSLRDCEKAEGTFFACERGQWDVNINTPGRLDFRIITVRSELVYDLGSNLRMELRLGNSRQFRDQYYDSDAGIRGDPDHPAYGLDRDGGQSEVSSAYQNRFGAEASVRHSVAGGLNGDNQYILDILGFPDLTIPLWEDQALITRFSNYDSRVYELQFSSIADPDNSVEWLAGIFFLHEDNSIRFDVESPYNFGAIKRPIALAFVQPNRDVDSIASFFQLDVPFSDRFRMTYGVRWTLDGKSDLGGLNYRTIGYWEAPYAYTSTPAQLQAGNTLQGFPQGGDPAGTLIPYSAYDLVGLVENPLLYQSNDVTIGQGTYADDILERIVAANTDDINENTFEDEWAQWTWKIGFDYIISDSLFFYGYIATGFKAGGFTDQVDLCGGQCGENPILDAFSYDPETNLSYELGIKSTLFSDTNVGTMNLIVTAFLSNIEDLQVTTFATLTPAGTELQPPTPPGQTERPDLVTVQNTVSNLLTYNIGEARNSGLEIEFDWWNPWPNGRINGWITYLNAEVRDLLSSDGYLCFERAYLGLRECPPSDPNIPDEPGTSEDESRRINFRGSTLPWSPEYALSLYVQHDFFLGGGLRLNPYISAHWSDEYFFDHNNFDEGPLHNGQPSYWSFSISLRLIDDVRNWKLEIYGRNLTDERIRVWQDTGPGYVRSNFVSPFNWGAKVVWTF